MLKKVAAVFAIIATVSTLVSAEISFDTPKNTNIQQEIASLDLSVPVAVPVEEKGFFTKVDKEWTVMVFINAKNNLEAVLLQVVLGVKEY